MNKDIRTLGEAVFLKPTDQGDGASLHTQNHLPRQEEASQEIDLCSSNELSRGWNPARESSYFSHVSHPPNVNCKHAVQNSLGHGDDQSQLKVRATLGGGGRGPEMHSTLGPAR